MQPSRTSVLLLLASALAANGPSSAAEPTAEWPQFLGPTRNGLSSETELIDKLPEAGPKVAWRVAGGVGVSGLAVSRGRLVTMVHREGKQCLIALDAATGAPQWETPLAPAYRNSMGDGPRGTPTVSGDRVVAFTGEGILAAVNFADGKLIWSRPVLQELKGVPADYGMACSPLVVGKQVIVTLGVPGATVASFDLQSGKSLWTAGNDDPAGYSSPVLLDVAGREQIVVFSGAAAMGLSTEKGTSLWRYPYETDFGCNIAVPLSYKGRVFLSAGENHGSVLLAFKPRGEEFDAEAVWESLGPKSMLRNEWQTSILSGDHLYGFDNVGGAGPVSHLTCIRADTGERVWQKVRFGKGNMIAADGKLFIVTLDGELVMVKVSPAAYEELGRAAVIGKTRQAPVLAGGFLYLRDDREIVCLDVRVR